MSEKDQPKYEANDRCRIVIAGGNQFPDHRTVPFPQRGRLISQQTSIKGNYHDMRILYIEVISLKDKKSKQLNKEVSGPTLFGRYATAPEMAFVRPGGHLFGRFCRCFRSQELSIRVFLRRILQAKPGWLRESPGDIAKHSVWEPRLFIKTTEAGSGEGSPERRDASTKLRVGGPAIGTHLGAGHQNSPLHGCCPCASINSIVDIRIELHS